MFQVCRCVKEGAQTLDQAGLQNPNLGCCGAFDQSHAWQTHTMRGMMSAAKDES